MSCSSSNRSITCIPYVTSSAWIRISARRDGVDARVEALESTSPNCSGYVSCRRGYKKLPERTAAADEVLPEAALRLVDPERARAAGRQPLEVLRLLVAVQAVAVLVHRGEERLERVGGSSS